MDTIIKFFKDVLNYSLILMPQVLEGLRVTLVIFILTLILSIPLGVIVALGRKSKIKLIRKVTGAYVLIMRGTPLLLQIVFIFFGLPNLNIVIDRFPAAILAFTLNYAAYFGEIFRAGIASVSVEQYEAAKVLGLSKRDTFFRIILPQAFKTVLPPIANEIVTLVKDTALVYVIGLDELLRVGKIACNRDSSLIPLIVIGIVYLILIAILSKMLNKVENKFEYYS
ncbi:L-cystine transport system permease protein tcyB [uncultured Clostridium sp.]|uniref:amino acid ABC transporter permease n=1 Tax=uncultured Clostridium sp. TaxID=59620 RepID=UPI00082330CE|nr:amino acid ABC transporter permease [uncultured Clostridium sp.]SCK01901.1 L-cystine transport system permease protein tcyB [uncultured Clostridium sp.]